MENPFEYEQNEKYTIIRMLVKKMHLIDISEISDKLEAVIEKLGYPNLIIEINNVKYLDSSGVGFFFKIMNSVKKSGSELVIVCDSGGIKRIIGMLKVQKIIKVFQYENEAIEYFIQNFNPA